MFTPKEYLGYRKKVGTYPQFKVPNGIIINYDSELMRYILNNHKTREVYFCGKKLYLLEETNNKIAVAIINIGAPASSVLLDELIAFGVKKFISIGIAGTLQKEIKIGSLMICNRAIRDEGTSYHYIKPSKYAYASKDLTNKIKSSFEKFKEKYFIGTSWTIDAPYRETIAEAKKYQKEGVSTVEMEASALFAVSFYRKVKLGAIFTISDSLSELEWKPKFHSKKTKKGLEMLYKISLDVLLN